MFPFELIVTGSPTSQQTNNRALLRSWKAKVCQAAIARLPAGVLPTLDPVQVIIAHYYEPPKPDVDNFIKPILDSLIDLVYKDDRQITDLAVIQRNINGLFKCRGMPLLVAKGFANREEFVYVKVDVNLT